MSAKSIMIVEDDEGAQFYLSVLLKKLSPGVDVFRAYDGQEATLFLSEFSDPPRLIFLDINMPVMDGLTFLQKNETLLASKNIDVVILTSSENADDRKALEGFTVVKDYLVKPVDAVDIKAHLHSLN